MTDEQREAYTKDCEERRKRKANELRLMGERLGLTDDSPIKCSNKYKKKKVEKLD